VYRHCGLLTFSIKLGISSLLIKHHAVKICGDLAIHEHPLLSLVADHREWSDSISIVLLQQKALRYLQRRRLSWSQVWSWSEARAGGKSTTTPSYRPRANHCTDWAISFTNMNIYASKAGRVRNWRLVSDVSKLGVRKILVGGPTRLNCKVFLHRNICSMWNII